MLCAVQKALREVCALNNNIKYRVKFEKTGNMIFIGHLDLLKFFQRTIKRAGLPIAYSLGFNPHQLITFAIPLSLGMESVGEYFDIQLTREMDCNEIVDLFNSAVPLGIKILSARKLKEGEKTCAAAVEVGDYKVVLPKSYDKLYSAIETVLNSNEINIERTVKKKTKITNIRPLIYSLRADKNEIYAAIATGSQGNLKIEILIEYIYKIMNEEYLPYRIDIVRQELYTKEKDEFKPL